MIPYIKQIISQSRAVAHKDVTKLCITKRPFWTMVLKSAFFWKIRCQSENAFAGSIAVLK